MAVGKRIYLKREMPDPKIMMQFKTIPASNTADCCGRSVARIMKYGYNMRVLGYSRHLTKERAELHVMFLKTGNEAEDFVWKISFDF